MSDLSKRDLLEAAMRKPAAKPQSEESSHAGATQADAGWRASEGAAHAGATQADAGWRASEGAAHAGATQADAGWRASEGTAHAGATQADAGWRASEELDLSEPDDVMKAATADAFVRLEDFQDAVEQTSVLETSKGNQYKVVKTISRAGGESIVLLCTDKNNNNVTAKVYFEAVDGKGTSVDARSTVLEYMKTKEGQKYTLAVSEIGLITLRGSKYYFEIMPYCESGDLSHEPAFTFDQIVELTKHLNEALHSMHTAGILHRDLKPENLYRLKGNVVIGDYGVAKLAKAGATRHTAGTDGYRAPESVLAVTAGESAFFFDEKCDYYSLGVTLGSLYEGHFVYKDMDAPMVTAAVRKGKLPLTKVDPKRPLLENLLNGLCRYDSNYRFGYEDVKKWLADHDYTGASEDRDDEGWPRPFIMFRTEKYNDERSLFMGITQDQKHWEEGKDLLYEGYFKEFFSGFRTDIAREAQHIDDKWRTKDADMGLYIFLKALYTPGAICWKGYTFNSLSELADKMVVTKNAKAYSEFLRKRIISYWLNNTSGIEKDAETEKLISAMEKLSDKQPELAVYWYGNSFAKKKCAIVLDKGYASFNSVVKRLFENPIEFYDNGLYEIVTDIDAGASVYGYLYSLGYKKVIDDTFASMKGLDGYGKFSTCLALFDTIAEKEKADPMPIRVFYVNYGPAGPAVFTRNLVNAGNVYSAIDAEGKKYIQAVASYQPTALGPVSEMMKNYAPLVDAVEKLQAVTFDNPFLLPVGAIPDSGVVCTNLKGYFAYLFLGRKAPLGFSCTVES